METAALIMAWEYWDDQPGQERSTNVREDLCQELADNLGVTATTLHNLIAYNRRKGMAPAEAIKYSYDKLATVIRDSVIGNTSGSDPEESRFEP